MTRLTLNHAGDGGRGDDETFPIPRGWVMVFLFLASWGGLAVIVAAVVCIWSALS
ncbi:MAG: hypothetical protein ABI414_08815 [Devosia sp.]